MYWNKAWKSWVSRSIGNGIGWLLIDTLVYRAHTNIWGSKFDLDVKSSNVNIGHHFSNFGRSPVPNNLWFWKRFLKVFTIYGHIHIFTICGQWTTMILAIFRSPAPRRLHIKFYATILAIFRSPKEAPYSKIGSAASEEKLFENVNGLTTDIAQVS